MDRPQRPKPVDFRLDLHPENETRSWRLTPPEGDDIFRRSLDLSAGGRSAAFEASVVAALQRTRRRRF
jgi:hypothetical protein